MRGIKTNKVFFSPYQAGKTIEANLDAYKVLIERLKASGLASERYFIVE